jgi:hypothetical protein
MQQQQQINGLLFTKYKGADVIGSDGKTIGAVADVIVDGQGSVQKIAISYGGVLGIGSTLKADQVSELPPLQDGKVKLDLTTASLKSLPTWEEPSGNKTAANNNGSAATTQGRASTSGAANPTEPAPGATATPGASAGAGGMSASTSGSANPSPNATAESNTAGNSSMTAQPGGNAPAANTNGENKNLNLSTNSAPGQAPTPNGATSNQSAMGSNGADRTNGAASSGSESSSGNQSAMTNANTPNGEMNGSAAVSGQMWPVSHIVGADIHKGDKTAGITDAVFQNGKLSEVVVNDGEAIGLGKGEQRVAFNELAITGTPADPKIMLQGSAAGGGSMNGGAAATTPAPSAPANGANNQ